jgi:hypothetical protein
MMKKAFTLIAAVGLLAAAGCASHEKGAADDQNYQNTGTSSEHMSNPSGTPTTSPSTGTSGTGNTTTSPNSQELRPGETITIRPGDTTPSNPNPGQTTPNDSQPK